jgi:hypothetical protein
MISHCTDYARRNYLLAIASRGLFRAIFTRRLVFSIYTLIMQSVLDYSNVLPTRREEMWWREKEKYQPGINSNYIWSLRSRLLGRHVLWDSPNRPLRPVRQSRAESGPTIPRHVPTLETGTEWAGFPMSRKQPPNTSFFPFPLSFRCTLPLAPPLHNGMRNDSNFSPVRFANVFKGKAVPVISSCCLTQQ